MNPKEVRSSLIDTISLTRATRKDLLVPVPGEPLEIAILRKVTWLFEQLDPERQALATGLDLREEFGENLYPSGITILSERPESIFIGLTFDADDFHDKTFAWEGITFDPFYYLIKAVGDKKDEELLVIDWHRNNPKDKVALNWQATLCNPQSIIEDTASSDTIFTTANRGQILLSLPPGMEGAPSSYLLEISNLRYPIRSSWIRR